MDYRQIVRDRAVAHGVDPNLAEALMTQESGGNPTAKSGAGAIGLLQLMPDTAKELGVNPNDPLQNIDGGLRYLKAHIDKHGVAGGLAAYNAGPGRLQKTGMDFSKLPAETQNYVPAVMNRAALIAEQRGTPMPQPVGQPSGSAPADSGPDLPTLLGGLEKAKAAGDAEAVTEISGIVQSKYKQALSRAQAAGDQGAVQELQSAMASFGSPQVAPVQPKAPTPAPTNTAAPTEAPKAPEERGFLRRVDDAVRGVADAVTFGFADEIAAKMGSTKIGAKIESLLGGSGVPKSYEEALKAQRTRDAEGGYERLGGQIAGALLPSGIAIRAADGASKLSRVGAGALTGAVQGGLYGAGAAEDDRVSGAVTGAALGGVAGGALSAVIPMSTRQEANRLIKKAGSEEAARFDAEIIKDIAKVAENPNQRGNPVTAAQLNAVENRYVNDVLQALKPLSKNQDLGEVRAAIQNRRALGPEELQALRTSPAGNAAADAIEKAQRARSLTQAMQSSGGVGAAVRGAVDWLPLPAPLHWGVKAMLGGRQTREVAAQKVLKRVDAADEVLSRLGPSRATGSLESIKTLGEQVLTANQAKAAAGQAIVKAKKGPMDSILNKVRGENQTAIEEAIANSMSGPSNIVDLANRVNPKQPLQGGIMDVISKVQQETAGAGVKDLKTSVSNEIKNILQDGKQTQATAKATQKAEQQAARQALVDTFVNEGKLGQGLSRETGSYRMFQQHVDAKEPEIFQALQEMAKADPSTAAKVTKLFSSGEKMRRQDFYSLQNSLIERFGRKELPAGALSEVTSSIANPIAYRANVENAMKALEVAKTAAPTKELEAFASTVARIKSQPEKAKALADRLAATTDPAEAAYLTKFVEPLTKHGKK